MNLLDRTMSVKLVSHLRPNFYGLSIVRYKIRIKYIWHSSQYNRYCKYCLFACSMGFSDLILLTMSCCCRQSEQLLGRSGHRGPDLAHQIRPQGDPDKWWRHVTNGPWVMKLLFLLELETKVPFSIPEDYRLCPY